MAELTYILNVLPGGKIIVPGCEPTSALSSVTLSRAMDCGKAIVDVLDALEAIPGSSLRFTNNFSGGQVRQLLFVLPPIDLGCPCATYDDFYLILKQLAKKVVEPEETLDHCQALDQGFCPPPGFENLPAPQENPYLAPGTTPFGAGFLTFPPKWNNPNQSPFFANFGAP